MLPVFYSYATFDINTTWKQVSVSNGMQYTGRSAATVAVWTLFFPPPLNKNEWTTWTLLTPERLEISEMLALKEYYLLSLNHLYKLWTADGRSFKKWLPVDKDTLPIPNLWMLCPGKLENLDWTYFSFVPYVCINK